MKRTEPGLNRWPDKNALVASDFLRLATERHCVIVGVHSGPGGLPFHSRHRLPVMLYRNPLIAVLAFHRDTFTYYWAELVEPEPTRYKERIIRGLYCDRDPDDFREAV